MQDVVVCQVLLLRAQGEEDRWKRTQASQEYERASFRARQMLDSHRTTYADKVKIAKKQLHKALERLVDLPDFATHNRSIGPGLTREALTTYTTEFKEWVQDLELHKRVLLEQATASPKRLTAKELFERGHWTFRELREAIAQLEERLNNTAEEIYADVYTRFDDFCLEDDEPIPPDDAPIDFGPQLDDLEITTNNVSSNVLQHGRRLAELKEKVNRLETEIALVADEKARMNQIAEQVFYTLVEFR
jgi:chaperonin cofactor prefoldin